MANSKKFMLPVIAMLFIAMFCSCGSTKKIVYFQGADTINLDKSAGLFDARIMPKDQLTIYVVTSDPEASKQFNMQSNMSSNMSSMGGRSSLQTFLVDNDGNINFPTLGFVHVQGLTKREVEKKILDLVKPYLAADENPIVTVRMTSFYVTMIGETGSLIIPVDNERMTIIEALASAGDLTMYGRRDNILLIREDATGKKSVHRLNISQADILNSPYYYLQQNDVIYVEPNKTSIHRQAIANNTLWISVLSSITSLISMYFIFQKL